MMKTFKVVFVLCLLSLSTCSGVQPVDSYTDHTGKTTLIQTDREACMRACNEDYSRCMDTEPAQVSGVNGPQGMFGASADCRSNLKDCLPSCNQ